MADQPITSPAGETWRSTQMNPSFDTPTLPSAGFLLLIFIAVFVALTLCYLLWVVCRANVLLQTPCVSSKVYKKLAQRLKQSRRKLFMSNHQYCPGSPLTESTVNTDGKLYCVVSCES